MGFTRTPDTVSGISKVTSIVNTVLETIAYLTMLCKMYPGQCETYGVVYAKEIVEGKTLTVVFWDSFGSRELGSIEFTEQVPTAKKIVFSQAITLNDNDIGCIEIQAKTTADGNGEIYAVGIEHS